MVWGLIKEYAGKAGPWMLAVPSSPSSLECQTPLAKYPMFSPTEYEDEHRAQPRA
jgi:hypothetical protein